MIPHKPILFSKPMVQAILDGRKIMTRRTQGLENLPNDVTEIAVYNEVYFWDNNANSYYCPYGKVGDLLWVKESYYAYGHWTTITENGKQTRTFKDLTRENYKLHQFNAEWQPNKVCKMGELGWHKRPSLFMQKNIARIWLKIEDIRVERLQDISEEDILNEGIRIPVSNKSTANNKVVFELTGENKAIHFLPKNEKPTQKNLLFAFWAELWCEINGRESWAANPWVWVIKFSRTEKPSDV